MNEDRIDVSLGLAFGLKVFKRYRQNGVLQAELPRGPGIRGRCKAFIYLVDGEVSSTYLEAKQGDRYSTDQETLCRLDREKGPFEWILIPQTATSHPSQSAAQSQPPISMPFAPSARNTSVLRAISEIPLERLSGWTPSQIDTLRAVVAAIDGRRTVEEIKLAVPFPPDLVDELLRILFELKTIDILA